MSTLQAGEESLRPLDVYPSKQYMRSRDSGWHKNPDVDLNLSPSRQHPASFVYRFCEGSSGAEIGSILRRFPVSPFQAKEILRSHGHVMLPLL